jgi:Fibrobacter succinogenes major domain (Fib_succ_major)
MKKFMFLIAALIIIVASCKKTSTSVVPVLATIATLNASSITSNTTASGGNITSDGGVAITERGICYNTTTNPTTANNKFIGGSGTGSFNSNMSGLTENTIYYVRAYAINSAGTSYGQVVEFITQFETVTIGTQIWMKKNLNVSTYRNGDPILQVTDTIVWAGLSTGAWGYYDNDSTNGSVYGKLYNWYAVNDSRNIAPVGWHVASDADWSALTTFLGGEPIAGAAMKETGTILGLVPIQAPLIALVLPLYLVAIEATRESTTSLESGVIGGLRHRH